MNEEAITRLKEIKEEIKALLYESREIIQTEFTDEYQTANSYWIPHIAGALDKDHEWLGGSTTTFQDTLDSINELETAVCSVCGDTILAGLVGEDGAFCADCAEEEAKNEVQL